VRRAGHYHLVGRSVRAHELRPFYPHGRDQSSNCCQHTDRGLRWEESVPDGVATWLASGPGAPDRAIIRSAFMCQLQQRQPSPGGFGAGTGERRVRPGLEEQQNAHPGDDQALQYSVGGAWAAGTRICIVNARKAG